MNNLAPEIVRRLQFVLDVVRNEEKSSQDLKMVMRVLSNFATLGRNGASGMVYRLNRYVSASAKSALEACEDFDQWVGNSRKDFRRRVINEHQLPLEQMVSLIKKSHEMGASGLWDLLKANPMVTILVEEDKELTVKAKGEVDPLRRYAKAGIEVVKLPVGAYEHWLKSLSITK